MKRILFAPFLLLAAPACQLFQPAGPAPDAVAESGAARVVDAHVEAYNRQDLEAYLRLFARNARIYLHPSQVVSSGADQIRARYRQQWRDNPRLRLQVTERMVQGNFVIDQERSVGWADGGDVRVVAIYEVRNGRIQNLWFIR